MLAFYFNFHDGGRYHIDWFLYDNGLRHERVKHLIAFPTNISIKYFQNKLFIKILMSNVTVISECTLNNIIKRSHV